MTIAHILCAVDSFRITQEGHDVFGDELRIEGRFLSHAATTGMEILFDTGLPLTIDLFRNDSAGVWMAHGEAFGDAARHCRFVAAHKVPDGGADFSSARLRVRTDDGNVFERALGAPAMPVRRASTCTPAASRARSRASGSSARSVPSCSSSPASSRR